MTRTDGKNEDLQMG